MNSWDLKGKRALVKGGSRGIGKAIANEFLLLGAEVLFTARHADEVAAVEQEFLQMGHSVHGTVADVVLDQDRRKLLEWFSRLASWRLLNSVGPFCPFYSKVMAP